MGLTKLAIERPIFIFMLMVASVLMGTMAYNSMRVELNPEVNFGTVTVTTIYPGAGPEEVNTLISREIEEAVSSVSNLQEVRSTSQEGVSVVSLQFDIGADMDAALNEVRAKVDSAARLLPNEAERPTVDKFDTASEPILYLNMRSESLSNRQLRDLADNIIKDRLAQAPGVARVAVSGGEVREIQVKVDKDELLRYGIGILDVQQAISSATLNVPGGRIIDGSKEYTVRLLGEFQSVESIGESYIQISDNQGPQGTTKIVKLKDIATIEDANAERRNLARLNGSESVTLVLQKARDGNAITISDALLKPQFGMPSVVSQLEKQYNVEFEVSQDASTQIRESQIDLQFTLIFGIILVTAVIWLFLHNFRGTLIVAIAIPICLFTTLIAMWGMGFTINNLSMLALSLAIGVLVDDAIVVIENIYRHLTMGEEPVQAAINGRAEIGLAAIAISLADVVVFVPIGFMGGIVGQFFRPLGLGFAVCVLASLFVSFTVTPMLASRWYRKGEDWEHPKGRFANWFERSFNRLSDSYANGVRRALNKRWYVFGLGFAVLVAVFMFIGGTFVLAPDTGGFAAGVPLAVLAGMGPAMMAVALGILIFSVGVIRLKFGSKVAALVYGIPLLLTVIVWIGSMVSPALGALLPIIGMLDAAVIVIGFLVSIPINTAKPYMRSRILVHGLLFAMIFPLAATTGYAYRNLYKKEDVFKFSFFPPSDAGQVNVTIDLPPGSSLAETERVVEQIEKVVMAHPDTKYTLSSVGSRSSGFTASDQGTQYAQISVTLHEKPALLDSIMFWVDHGDEHWRTQPDTSVAADLLQQIGRVPGARVTVAAAGGVGFGAPIQLSFRSDDREKLVATAEAVRDALAGGAVEGVITPDISSKSGKPELQAIPDRAKMSDAGLTAAQVGAALRVMYEGDNSAKYRELGREYDIRVQLSDEDRSNPEAFRNVPISFSQGKPIYLDQVATVERGQALDKIDRRNRIEEIQVTADLLPGYAAGTVQQKIDTWMTEEGIVPEDVAYQPLGQADFQAREGIYLFTAFGLGLVLVYMLLASLYDNLLYPFIIQLAQPQAMVGALLALMLTDKTLNLVGFIGIIALVGLVGKNAILLVDYTNTLRERGKDRFEALVESGRTRLRPIMMTTLALVMGMLPVAMAIGRGSEFRETIGITIIGGVLVSTVLTLFVIPCSYSIFDDFSMMIGRGIQKISGRMMSNVDTTGGTGHHYEEPSAPSVPEEPEGKSEL